MKRPPCMLAAALLGLCASAGASETVLRADSPVFGDQYGQSVAIDGDLAVVGMPGDDSNANDAGAVYVYRHTPTGWMVLQRLYGSQADAQFGYSVAVVRHPDSANADDVIAVGSRYGDGVVASAGNVTMYRRIDPATTFAFEQTVATADGSGFDQFGYAIALDLSVPGESTSGVPVYTLVVGAPYDESPGTGFDAGSVYVYQGSATGLGGWSPITKLLPSDIVGGDYLGRSVAIHGDLAIVGATGWSSGNNPEGVAYLLRRFYDSGAGYFNWEINSRLKASDGTSGDRFGARVAIDQVPVVSAPNAGNTGGGGAVYVFCCKASIGYDLTESRKIAAPDPPNRTSFGTTLATDGTLVMVGDATYPGHLDVFRANTSGIWSWSLAETTAIADSGANQADALALALPHALVGDPLRSGGGAAYLLSDSTLNDPVFRDGFE